MKDENLKSGEFDIVSTLHFVMNLEETISY